MKIKERSPVGIGKDIWNSWIERFEPDPMKLIEIVQEMIGVLYPMEKSPLTWEKAARGCLERYWQFINELHSSTMPEMACQRSGKCCMKQVPRVSMFEIKEIAKYIGQLPAEQGKSLMEAAKKSVTEKYIDPVIGEGVPCPMLIKNSEGKHACAVHPVRPYICRFSGVSTTLSWDCPIWQVYKSKFPTIDDDLVRPFLVLFSHCRNIYARLFLPPNVGRSQMALLGTGLLYTYGWQIPTNEEQPDVTSLYGHHTAVSEDLWLHKLPTPPEDFDVTQLAKTNLD